MSYNTNDVDVIVDYLEGFGGNIDVDYYLDCGDDSWLCLSIYLDGDMEIFPDISGQEISEYLEDFAKEPARYEITKKGE
jgi:hypothetical protein